MRQKAIGLESEVENEGWSCKLFVTNYFDFAGDFGHCGNMGYVGVTRAHCHFEANSFFNCRDKTVVYFKGQGSNVTPIFISFHVSREHDILTLLGI